MDTLTLVMDDQWELGALGFSGYWFHIIHRTLRRDDGHSDILTHRGTQIVGDYALVWWRLRPADGHSINQATEPMLLGS
jgi:hypothetical protein